MKKFVIFLITSVAMIQSTYAATSPLGESLLEYEAITSAIGTDPAFQNVIPQNEFITEFKRLTKHINVLGEVRYGIVTRTAEGTRTQTNKYIATLNVSANPNIGPSIVTVESITPFVNHHHSNSHN